MWTNYHTHSAYCDGKGKLSDYYHKALEGNMKVLGFSSHATLPFNCAWSMDGKHLDEYLSEIKKLKQLSSGLEIYAGLEVDYIPGLISPNQFSHQLDYTIGSIHFVEKWPDGTPWEIDGSHSAFLSGLHALFENNIREVVCQYYQLTREMITTAAPDIVGHLDKIKIQNPNDKFFTEEESWYKAEIMKTVEAIQETGAIVEVNTRGLYRQKSATPYPSPWILEILCKKNIPVMINSDAHHPDDLTNQFIETAAMLQKIGFKKLTVLHEGDWRHFKFTPHGIEID